MAKAWPALDIHVPGCDPELQDLVLAELDDFHPTAIHDQDAEQKLRAFFAGAEARDAAARALGAAFGTHLFVQPVDVEDEDWAARSQAGLRAVTVGRITVAPPWDVLVQVPGSDPMTKNVMGSDPITVLVQPSMGFGTGHHATTRLMLGALQMLDVQDRDLLDIGCGSGVLAIAGALLGARSAVGLDVDPDALQSAAENTALNGVAGRVRLQEGDFRELATPYAVVLANLTGALLERHASTLAALVEPDGYLVVSGFLDGETSVVSALENFLALQSVSREDEWRCAIFQRLA